MQIHTYLAMDIYLLQVDRLHKTMNNITVSQLTTEIRRTVGTPFHHAGRVSGVDGGLDCGGILIVSLTNLGFAVHDVPHYKKGDNLNQLINTLRMNSFSQKNGNQYSAGDVILIRGMGILHHLVYYTEFNSIIHSWITTGLNRVVESAMLPEWIDNIHSVWRFDNLVEG